VEHTVYRLADGTRVPSVTTVLGAVIAKPQLVRWANREGLAGREIGQTLSAAADVGTYVHELARSDLSGVEPKLPDLLPEQQAQAAAAFTRYLEWKSRRRVRPVAVECQMVSEQYRFGGTYDAIMEDLDRPESDRLEIWDYKTSGGIWDDYLYQTAGYRQLAHEHGYAVSRVWLIRLPKGDQEPVQTACWEGGILALGWSVFDHALEIYRLQQEIAKRRRAEFGV
jgi:hypothetical protein